MLFFKAKALQANSYFSSTSIYPGAAFGLFFLIHLFWWQTNVARIRSLASEKAMMVQISLKFNNMKH